MNYILEIVHALAAAVQAHYLVIIAYALFALWQGWFAWRRHPHSILSSDERRVDYARNWALCRWWFSVPILITWLLQEAVLCWRDERHRPIKFHHAVTQVDWWFCNLHNNQYDDKREPPEAGRRRIFYENE